MVLSSFLTKQETWPQGLTIVGNGAGTIGNSGLFEPNIQVLPLYWNTPAFPPPYTFNLFPTSLSTCTSNAHVLCHLEFLWLASFLDLMPSLGANKSLGITESGASGTCTEFLASSTTSELEWNITLQNMGSGIPTQPAEGLDNTLWKYERISFPWGQFCPKENQKWNESKQRTSLLWVFF